MRWSYRKCQNPLKWHDWFAWHPVHVGIDWVWLETVSRRMATFYMDYEWEYEHRS